MVFLWVRVDDIPLLSICIAFLFLTLLSYFSIYISPLRILYPQLRQFYAVNIERSRIN